MSDFVEFLHDVFSSFGRITCRRMFGGWGVYRGEVMFGLIAGDTLYLKANEETANYFLERDLPPFRYDKAGKVVTLSYYQAPEEIFDDPEEARIWADRAYGCALAAKNGRPGKR